MGAFPDARRGEESRAERGIAIAAIGEQVLDEPTHAGEVSAVDHGATLPHAGCQLGASQDRQMARGCVLGALDRQGNSAHGDPAGFMAHQQPKYGQPRFLAECRKCGLRACPR